MKLSHLLSLGLSLAVAAPLIAQNGPNNAAAVINSYITNAYAKNLDGVTAVFANSPSTYFHINGIYYFTVDSGQSVFQIASDHLYADGWTSIYSGFANYFSSLVTALSVKTIVRTQDLSDPIDGGDKLDGETNYVILAKFILDSQGSTGWAIVHGLDQFRIKNGHISNINNFEKDVFLSAQESAALDSMPSDAARIGWAQARACQLYNSVYTSIDQEKRWPIGLNCQ
jgi:hypothetical protein